MGGDTLQRQTQVYLQAKDHRGRSENKPKRVSYKTRFINKRRSEEKP